MYSEEHYQRVRSFLTEECHHSSGSRYGQKLQLIPFQETMLKEIYGNVDDTGKRITRKVYVSACKGFGKTFFASICALHHLLNDDEPAPMIGLVAYSKEQAGHLFDECLRQIELNPHLKKVLKINKQQKTIYYPAMQGTIKVISRVVQQVHGYSWSLLVVDELHVIENEEYLQGLVRGCAKDRKQSLLYYLTTAGIQKTWPGYQIYNYAKKVRDGKVVDPTFKTFLWEADEADDPSDENVWRKAMPGLGYNLSIDNIRQEYQSSVGSNVGMASWRQLFLNIWGQPLTQFINIDHWDACQRAMPKLDGKRITLGCDLSSKRDLSALVGIILHKGTYYVKCWAWTTEQGLLDREDKMLTKLKPFVDAGELYVETDDSINYATIRAKIAEINKVNPVDSISFCQWGAKETMDILMADVYTVYRFPQTCAAYHEPLMRLEKLVKTQRLAHDGNGLLRWCLGNMHVKDKSGLYYPVKERSIDRIDCATALLFTLWQVVPEELAPRPSPYESKRLAAI